MALKFANFARSTIATTPSPATTGTSLTVAAGQGSRFPTLGVGDYFYAVMVRRSDNAKEIVKVTARSTDTMTIDRAQEGTTGLTFTTGDYFENRLTAEQLATYSSTAVANTWSGAQTFTDAATFQDTVDFDAAVTFDVSPTVPDGVAASDAASVGQLDAEAAARTAAIAAAVLPATLAPTLFVEAASRALSGFAAVEWTGLPSWVRQIVVVIDSQSGTSTGVAAVRIGAGGVAETTGYTGTGSVVVSSSAAVAANSTSWLLANTAAAASVHSHTVTIGKATGNTWVYCADGALHAGNGTLHGGGNKTLAGTLNLVQLLITAGTFDGGVATLYYR